MEALRRHNRHLRSGAAAFTLIEVAVTVLILGVLVALLVPAVQFAREAARRSQCQRNLASFGLALSDFESRRGCYPTDGGPQVRGPDGFERLMDYSVQAQLLADLGFPVDQSQFNLGRPAPIDWVAPIGGPPRPPFPDALPRIPVFLCPSDMGTLGLNYRTCTGSSPQPLARDALASQNGVFARDRRTRAADVTDGLSQTAAMSERIKSAGDNNAYMPPEDYWNIGAGGLLGIDASLVSADQMRGLCSGLTGSPPSFVSGLGTFWITPSYAQTNYNHVGLPNEISSDCALGASSGLNAQSDAGLHAARSRHRGGANVLYLDGSVRFVNSSLDWGIWQAMGTIRGNEAVGEIP